MKEFWVDYCASIKITAETEEEAMAIFYQCYCDETREMAEVVKVETVEEREEY